MVREIFTEVGEHNISRLLLLPREDTVVDGLHAVAVVRRRHLKETGLKWM